MWKWSFTDQQISNLQRCPEHVSQSKNMEALVYFGENVTFANDWFNW